MDRTDRQKLGIRKWIKSGGAGVLCYATGVGKTNTSLMLASSLINKNKNTKVLIAVPTEVLKEQWMRECIKRNIFSNCKIEIFNSLIKNTYDVDLFIIDEAHLSASEKFIYMYECVTYKYILGLSATWERLDGGHLRLERYMQICDTITLEQALQNGWIAPYRNYKVLVDVDLTTYYELNQRFQSVFAVFGHDFKLIMDLVQHPKKVKLWAQKHGYPVDKVRGFLAVFMRLLRQRKAFVMSHPKKFEIANKILDARPNSKCIVFSATVKDAEMFKHRALTLHSQKKKKENAKILEKFNQMEIGVISSPKALNQGVDVKGLSVGVAITCDSSQTTNVQKIGRICRFEEGKQAEMFTLVVKNTIENTWFDNANKNTSYITITEKQLDTVLKNEYLSVRPKKGVVDLEHRF